MLHVTHRVKVAFYSVLTAFLSTGPIATLLLSAVNHYEMFATEVNAITELQWSDRLLVNRLFIMPFGVVAGFVCVFFATRNYVNGGRKNATLYIIFVDMALFCYMRFYF